MKHKNYSLAAFTALVLACLSCGTKHYDVIIRNGMIYDGNGGSAFPADIGINADTIAQSLAEAMSSFYSVTLI